MPTKFLLIDIEHTILFSRNSWEEVAHDSNTIKTARRPNSLILLGLALSQLYTPRNSLTDSHDLEAPLMQKHAINPNPLRHDPSSLLLKVAFIDEADKL